MNQRLKNIYTYLIQNRKHNLIGWYNEYKEFSDDIDKIRVNLSTLGLRDNATYFGTSFEKSTNPFDDFISKLLFEMANGISSRGQSVLSGENLANFKKAQGFDDVIKNIVTAHDFKSYEELQKWWINQNVGNNPVLINRAIADCTREVSSTVDEGKFNQVFYWLQKELLIPNYPN